MAPVRVQMPSRHLDPPGRADESCSTQRPISEVELSGQELIDAATRILVSDAIAKAVTADA